MQAHDVAQLNRLRRIQPLPVGQVVGRIGEHWRHVEGGSHSAPGARHAGGQQRGHAGAITPQVALQGRRWVAKFALLAEIDMHQQQRPSTTYTLTCARKDSSR